MSVAPEIARLAEAVLLAPEPSAVHPQGPAREGLEPPAPAASAAASAAPVFTLGRLAGQLRMLAATPERWWGLVRFNPGYAVKIAVEDHACYQAWLVVLPPGDGGQACDCDVVTMIAGEATEAPRAPDATNATPSSAALRPGSLRVHGQRHWLRGQGAGYSISLHARTRHPAIPTAGIAGVIG
jgi:hypothetical protein